MSHVHMQVQGFPPASAGCQAEWSVYGYRQPTFFIISELCLVMFGVCKKRKFVHALQILYNKACE